MHSKEWCKCIGCHGIACSSLFFLYYICEITLKIFAFFNLLSIFFSLTNGKSWLLRSVFRENRASKTKRNTQEDHIFFFVQSLLTVLKSQISCPSNNTWKCWMQCCSSYGDCCFHFVLKWEGAIYAWQVWEVFHNCWHRMSQRCVFREWKCC